MSSTPRFTKPRGQASEEVEFHLEMLEQQLRVEGMSAEQAKREALTRFGDIERTVVECQLVDSKNARRWRRVDWWSELSSDFALGLRKIQARPGFSATAVLPLALGIGAVTALFALLSAVLLRPLPYLNSEQLVVVSSENAERGFDGMPLPPGVIHSLRDDGLFAQLSAFQSMRLTLTGGHEPQRVPAVAVTEDLLATLGRVPSIGRSLSRADGLVDADPVCLISDNLWRNRFGADPTVPEQSIQIEGQDVRVIGVLPPDLQFSGSPLGLADVWTVSRIDDQKDVFGSWYLAGLARLEPGVTLQAAQARLDLAAANLADRLPFGDGWSFRIHPLTEEVVGNVRPALLVLFGAVVLVLLIACVNLANLLVAQTHERSHEMRVRASLGASRVRLVRQVLTENAALTGLSGIIGLGLSTALTPLLAQLAGTEIPRLENLTVDGRVIAFSLAATLMAALASGFVPALQVAPRGTLGRRLAGAVQSSPRQSKIRNVLVIGEIALAMVLLIGAGLLLKSFDRLVSVDPGFRSQALLTMTIDLPESSYPAADRHEQFFSELQTRISALPVIRASSQVSALPTTGSFRIDELHYEGEVDPSAQGPTVAIDVVTPGFFRLLEIPLFEGRDFDPADAHGSELVAVVNEELANKTFPGESAIGKRILASDDESLITVVGVVGNVRQNGPRAEAPLQVYLPRSQLPARRMSLIIDARVEPHDVLPSIKAIVHQLDPLLPITNVATFDSVVASTIARDKFNALLMTAFAALAAILAAGGIYGIVTFSVNCRLTEFGVRATLGATASDLRHLVIRAGLGPICVGLLLGLSGAVLLGGALESLLFGVETTDPMTLATTSLAIFGLGVLASLAPAARAARIDPATLLHSD